MPIGETVVEVAGQLAMEAGGEEIKKRYGWFGCIVAILIIAALVTVAIWYFS